LKEQPLSEQTYTVRAYQSADARAFAELNRRWIEEYFGMEDEDRRVLEAPEEAILKPGGYIAIAEENGEAIGTGALILPETKSGETRWGELVKMATDPASQGKGVGGAVLDHLIAFARTSGVEKIWLETNDRLTAATALYQRKGFRALEAHEKHPTPYSRCNLQMILDL
jgi:putative acetyltransferase